jgi:SNF2 family DNA or RNA helicase
MNINVSTTEAQEVDSNNNIKKFNKLLEKSGYGFKQYQYDGAEWCLKCEEKLRGGIYADEMGLGKTFTMIAVMFMNFKRRTLIVLPPVLVEQWIAELYKCTGHIPAVYYGSRKKGLTQEDLERSPIVITTYGMLLPKNKKEKIGETVLHKIKWNRVIFDEAHHLRNSRTTRFNSSNLIISPIRWLVTGTPIQNRRNDLYSLCKILGIDNKKYKNLQYLKENIDKYMIKRTKQEVGILLPPVINHLEKVEWKDKNEKMLAEEIHSLIPDQSFVSLRNNTYGLLAKSIIDSTENYKLLAFLKARQSCVLPSLIKTDIESIEDNQKDHVEVYNKGSNYNSKLDAVIDRILERKNNGNGKIIFCHFRKEIDFVTNKLRQGGLKKVVTFDGRNNKREIGTLSEAADAIVIQIQTGCEGLNLQKNFSEVYFVSPHWNPAIEDQAVARCYRIGQTKPTNVFRFGMVGFDNKRDKDEADEEDKDPQSLESYVHFIQESKRKMIGEVIN